MFIIVFLLLLMVASPAIGGDLPNWVTNTLNAPHTRISEDSDAILLLSDTELSFKNGKIKSKIKLMYKITHLKGLDYGSLYVSGDKNTRVSRIKGYRLNESGELLEELKSDNIVRRAYNEDFYDDAEQLYANFERVEIGDIVAFEYETRSDPFFNQNMFWMGSTVEIATKRIHVPPNSYCQVMNDPEGQVSFSGRTYEIKNQAAIPTEKWDPPLRDRIPVLGVLFDTTTADTWTGFSARQWQKTKGLDNLSPESVADLNHLLSLTDQKDFILKTLAHVSESVGYLDIEVAEGRFIPTECNIVHDKKYGDCKDMAYYAQAILKKGGVTAHPVLARTKRIGGVLKAFPSAQFNHAILAVELTDATKALKNAEMDGKPVLVADLTDKFTHPPMVPSSLENTFMLPLTESGSNLFTMSESSAEMNVKEYIVKLKYHGDQSVTGDITETLTGHGYTREKHLRAGKDGKEKDKMYRDWLQDLIPGAHMAGISVNDDQPGTIVTSTQFTASNIGTDINGDLYFGPNVIDSTRKGYRKRKRDADLVFSYPYIKKIHVEAEINPHFTIVSVPEATSLDNEHFSFDSTITVQEQTVILDCTYTLKTTRVTTDDYKAFRKAYKKYLKAAKAQIVVK